MHLKSLFFILLVTSCTSVIKKATKQNRKFVFNTQTEYYDYLTSKKHFLSDQILFLDSLSYVKFGQEALMVENPVVYFGSFLNDSVSIKKSNLLKDNQACIGRMNGEIEKNLGTAEYVDSMVESKINLSKFNLYYLYNKRKFSLEGQKKQLNIFLLYYYPFGTSYDKLYKEIEEACLINIEKTNLFIICVDPIYALKN